MSVSHVFLVILLVCITAHSVHLLLLEYAETKLYPRMRNHRTLRYIPVTSVGLSIAVVIASTLTKPGGPTQCPGDSDINADIGGIGVLLGLFLPSAFNVVVLLSGHWKAEPSGAKELCVAHMANLLYLTVNLAKSYKDLNIRDSVVACCSIDAISASISMAISDKDVLAARKLVMASFALQIPAFVIEGITLGRLSRLPSSCLTTLHHPTISSSKALMWTYFAVRTLTAVAPAPTVWRLIQRLNEIEHAPRQSQQVKDARNWESLPATVSTNYIAFSSLTLIQIIPTLNITQATLQKSAEKLRQEWGQSAALIVAMVSISHVLISFACLFRSEAVGHRLKVCQINRTSTVWASPPRTWRTGFWKLLQQRSPFGKIVLGQADELLVDATQLLRSIDMNLSLEEQDTLWGELMEAFSQNDATYVMDCLDRGAPVNRLSEGSKEYPVHMAARLGNLEILQRIQPYVTHFRSNTTDRPTLASSIQGNIFEMGNVYHKNPPSSSYERLVSGNADEQTPLSLAISANQTSAAQHLLLCMLNILRTSGEQVLEIREAIGEVLVSVIKAEKTDMLKIIADAWPSWEIINLIPYNYEPCYSAHFALLHAKPKSMTVIMSRTEPPYWNSRLNDRFNSLEFWDALSNDTSEDQKLEWFTFMRQHIPGLETDHSMRFIGITNSWIQQLLEMGWDGDTLCNTAINTMYTGGPLLMAGYPADDLSSLNLETLDYVLSNVRGATEDAMCRWETAGARDWDQFLRAAGRADMETLKDLILAESSKPDGDIFRMTNAIWTNGMLEGSKEPNHRVLAHTALIMRRRIVIEDDTFNFQDVDDSVTLLLQHGSSVLDSSSLADSVLMDVLTNGRSGHFHHDSLTGRQCRSPLETTLIILLRAAVSEESRLVAGTDTALHICCQALKDNHRLACRTCMLRCFTALKILLDSGCDPASVNGSGKTPRDMLQEIAKSSYRKGFESILNSAIEFLLASEQGHSALSPAEPVDFEKEEWGEAVIYKADEEEEDEDYEYDVGLEWCYRAKTGRKLR